MASASAAKRAENRANGKRAGPKHNIEAVRQEYYDRISRLDMAPLWKVMKTSSPRSR